MKSFPLNGFRVATAVAAVLLMPVGLRAGEALQFSNIKSRPDPNQRPTLPGEASKPGFELDVRGTMRGVAPSYYDSRRRDPRAERKAQNAEDEKRNWMVLDPGQLDAEDEAKGVNFGIRDYDLEKSQAKRDYFFNPTEKADRPGASRQQPGPGKNRNSSEADADQGDNQSKGSQSVSKDGQPVGDHVVKAFDLKDLLAPGKANSLAPVEDKTTKQWKDVLGSGTTGESRAEAPGQNGGSAADGFRPAAPSSFRAQESTPSSLRNDFSPRPAAGSAGLSGSGSSRISPPAAPLAPRGPDPVLSRPYAPVSVGRAPTPNDPFNTRQGGSSYGSAGSSYGQQSTQPPRRQSSGNFELPARPGYGGR